jgi:hypothetical protein
MPDELVKYPEVLDFWETQLAHVDNPDTPVQLGTCSRVSRGLAEAMAFFADNTLNDEDTVIARIGDFRERVRSPFLPPLTA